MDIEHYTSPTGRTPTLEYLDGLPDEKHKKRIYDDISRLKIFGQQKMITAGKIEKVKGCPENIWELRTSCPNNIIYRTLFGIRNGTIVILNIFNKKEARIRRPEIAKSIARFQKSI
jgi:putative component of toxin-antitoxin plasmid stabilization module